MKRVNLCAIILLMISQFGFAGNDFNLREEFAKRKLIIVLFEEDTEQNSDAKSKDDEVVQKQKSNIDSYNENLKLAFNEYWGDKPQEFMLQSKVELLTNTELLNYSVLSMSVNSMEGLEFFVFKLYTVYEVVTKKGKQEFELQTTPFKVNIQNEIPSKADLCFLISNMKIYMGIEKEFNREQLDELLARKTLVIDKEFVEITEAKIKVDYAFPFKISSTEEIVELADKNDTNSLYLRLGIETRRTNKGTTKLIDFMIIDCATGKILSRCNISGLAKVSLNAQSEHSKNVKAEQKAIADYKSGLRSSPVYTGPRGGSFVGKEMARIYTAKAKLKGAQLKYLSSGKLQLKSFNPLMLY